MSVPFLQVEKLRKEYTRGLIKKQVTFSLEGSIPEWP